MSQQNLVRAHRLLTAGMIAKAKGRDKQPSLDLGFSAADLEPLGELPLIGCHVDPRSQKLVIALAERERLNAAEHERQLRRALPEVALELVYTTHVDHAAPSRTAAARPLWGGVEMDNSEGDGGTLTLVVLKSGERFTLLSAHVVGVGKTGVVVGQPSVDQGRYGAVTDNPAGPGRTSDSALASIDHGGIEGEPDRIWRAPDSAYHVIAKAQADQLTLGTRVYMQGAASGGLQEGRILATDVTSARPSGLVLTGQILADYGSTAGDSGAPIFLAGVAGEVTFAGIHVGTHSGGDKLFSPWGGIAADLGL